MSARLVLLLVCIVASCFAQYTGYPQMGSLTLKLLVKGTACGASDALANKIVNTSSTILAYNITKASIIGKAPPEKTCVPVTPPPPTSTTTGAVTPPPTSISSDPVKVSVFTGDAWKADVEVAPYGMYRLLFTITVKHSGMVAIGFPKDKGLMINADAVIGWGSSPLVPSSIADYSIGTERSSDCTSGGICKDFHQNLEGAEVAEVDGITTLKFLRPRIPDDSNDVTFVDPMKQQDINIALGSSYGLSSHGSKRTSTTVMIPGGVTEPVSSGTTATVTAKLTGTAGSTTSAVNNSGIQQAGGFTMDLTATILFIALGVLVLLGIILAIVLVMKKKNAAANDFNAYSRL